MSCLLLSRFFFELESAETDAATSVDEACFDALPRSVDDACLVDGVGAAVDGGATTGCLLDAASLVAAAVVAAAVVAAAVVAAAVVAAVACSLLGGVAVALEGASVSEALARRVAVPRAVRLREMVRRPGGPMGRVLTT